VFGTLTREAHDESRRRSRPSVLQSAAHYWHVGGGVSFSTGPVDLFVSVTKYVSGTDTHNGQVITVGSTWYFDLSKNSSVSPAIR
jgi:hypothetical protein